METILRFCEGLERREVAAGETLLTFGEVDNRLYILSEGELEVSNEGVRINTQDEPGAIFGEMSVLLGVPHTATVTALTPSRVCIVENASEFLQSHADITFYVTKLLARRLKGASDYLVNVKQQFEDQADLLAIVNEVLPSLLYEQDD
jgi:CRP-like cAMP-binding protein